jgi:nitroreductase
MRKHFLFLGILFVMIAAFLPAQSADDPALRPIIRNFSPRSFGTGSISSAELSLIIQAGIRAPSAGNRQPWHFTVVQNQALARRLVPQTTEGNILIVVSGSGDGVTNGAVILDCALAVQSMYLAAQALGLGSRIYTGPVSNINANFKQELGLPNGHSVVAVIRIGRLPPGVDAVSSASARNNADRMVTYK